MRRQTINAPDWLTARPIAHRGLHSRQNGLVENTPAAAMAAIAKNYAIECDVQLTKDGEAVVFHDAALDRLMQAKGRVDAFNAGELGRLSFKECDQTIVSLPDFVSQIGGRVPVMIDIKSHYDGNMRLAQRVLGVVTGYSGPVCLKSFDPEILVHLRRAGVPCPVGLIARAGYDDAEWATLSQAKRASFMDLTDFPLVQPDFLSWNHSDLPHAVPMLCRGGMGMPVMTWAVNSDATAQQARLWADQIVFEDFEP